MTMTLYEHWNQLFATTEEASLGWFERDTSRTLRLLDPVTDWHGTTVFLPGIGTSALADQLLARGARLILNDISDEALRRLRRRLDDPEKRTAWLHHDIARPLPEGTPPSDRWIDRAALHFLVSEEAAAGYFDNLRHNLQPGGYALFAEFSPSGAPRCAGLPVHRYSAEELGDRLGPGFSLVRQEDHVYRNPAGDPRPYLYALFKKDGVSRPAAAAAQPP